MLTGRDREIPSVPDPADGPPCLNTSVEARSWLRLILWQQRRNRSCSTTRCSAMIAESERSLNVRLFFECPTTFLPPSRCNREPAGHASTNHSTSLKWLKNIELLSNRHNYICSSSQTVPRSKARDSSRPLPGTGTSHAPPRRGLTEAGAAHPRTQVSKPCSTTDSFSPCWSVIAGGPDFRHTTNPGNWRRHDSVSFPSPGMATRSRPCARSTTSAPRFEARAGRYRTRRPRTPGLRVDTRLTCPRASSTVQRIPVQKEGFNEGRGVKWAEL